ncbi:glycoside hydrolase family 78 protein, partial [Dothistroma septosporum NZE10]
MTMLKSFGLSLLAGLSSAAQYEEYILAPSSRELHPVSVYKVNGTVNGAESLTGHESGSGTFEGVSSATYDFGKNTAGRISLTVGDVEGDDQAIGIAFSESSSWITDQGSDSTANAGLDELLWVYPDGSGKYTVGPEHERGGFRYLSLIHNTTGSVEVEQITIKFTPMPHWADDGLKDYTGYFHCNDELINRIWYAGAYTNQLCTINPQYGNSLVHLDTITANMTGDDTPPNTWYNNLTITNGTSALVDGAKRDRLVWAGDMAIAVPGLVVSTNDLITVANSLDSLFGVQDKTTGQLPYAGVGFRSTYSATYHLYTLIGVSNYYMYSDKLEYVENKWSDYKQALNFSLSFIDESGMMNVTSAADWLRSGMGGHNIEANSILYYTIYQSIMLGQALGETQSLLASWIAIAENIKTAANKLLWDETEGLYHDNETTTLQPQDGNSWAVVANLTDSDEKVSAISSALQARWGDFGAPAPEADDAVSPFISGFELQAHLLADDTTAALNLMRLQWGFMLDDPRMTNSTFIEGYASDGRLHYAPYTNDPRVSHAHGWSTGPTSTLTFYIGGIHLASAGGRTWELSPRPGDLTFVDAGFQTSEGMFVSQVNATGGVVTGFKFSTPVGTNGRVSLPGISGSLKSSNGTLVALKDGEIKDLAGGDWILVPSGNSTAAGGSVVAGNGSPVPYTGSAMVISASLVAIVAGA